MIDDWDKGPRDRTKTAMQMHEAADWIYRLGRRVVIELHDLNGRTSDDTDSPVGVTYGYLALI